MNPGLPRVCAAIVVYRPDLDVLAKGLASIAPQVANVLVIANDGAPWACPLPANASLARLGENRGLGAAYNMAAQWARTMGATHLLLLDQDSIPTPGLVCNLLNAYRHSEPIAAVGPFWKDRRTGRDGFFVRLGRLGARKVHPKPSEIVPVDFLISSGSLISLEALARIGPFDEDLFIEHVDTDWSLRARANGYRLYGVADARLKHSLGEADREISVLGLRQRLFLYNPERHYYLLRNSILLWQRAYAPWAWVLHDIRRTAKVMLYYALFVPPRRERLRWMVRAIRDAVKRTRTPTIPA